MIGCICKVISKTLTNRLKPPFRRHKYAFISCKEILDGDLVDIEIVEEAKRNKKKMNLCKVDFEKAYDSIYYNFLLYVMQKMGLHEK